MILDLEVLRDRLRAALPQLTYELVELVHEDTRVRYPALLIETSDRRKDHVYRMTIAAIDNGVNFFVHVHGTSKDLTTQGAHCFGKADVDLDEVFAIAHSGWTGSTPT